MKTLTGSGHHKHDTKPAVSPRTHIPAESKQLLPEFSSCRASDASVKLKVKCCSLLLPSLLSSFSVVLVQERA